MWELTTRAILFPEINDQRTLKVKVGWMDGLVGWLVGGWWVVRCTLTHSYVRCVWKNSVRRDPTIFPTVCTPSCVPVGLLNRHRGWSLHFTSLPSSIPLPQYSHTRTDSLSASLPQSVNLSLTLTLSLTQPSFEEILQRLDLVLIDCAVVSD